MSSSISRMWSVSYSIFNWWCGICYGRECKWVVRYWFNCWSTYNSRGQEPANFDKINICLALISCSDYLRRLLLLGWVSKWIYFTNDTSKSSLNNKIWSSESRRNLNNIKWPFWTSSCTWFSWKLNFTK